MQCCEMIPELLLTCFPASVTDVPCCEGAEYRSVLGWKDKLPSRLAALPRSAPVCSWDGRPRSWPLLPWPALRSCARCTHAPLPDRPAHLRALRTVLLPQSLAGRLRGCSRRWRGSEPEDGLRGAAGLPRQGSRVWRAPKVRRLHRCFQCFVLSHLGPRALVAHVPLSCAHFPCVPGWHVHAAGLLSRMTAAAGFLAWLT